MVIQILHSLKQRRGSDNLEKLSHNGSKFRHGKVITYSKEKSQNKIDMVFILIQGEQIEDHKDDNDDWEDVSPAASGVCQPINLSIQFVLNCSTGSYHGGSAIKIYKWIKGDVGFSHMIHTRDTLPAHMI